MSTKHPEEKGRMIKYLKLNILQIQKSKKDIESGVEYIKIKDIKLISVIE